MSNLQIEDIYPVSSLQGLWLEESLIPGRFEHHKHLGWQYAGPLEVGVLSRAWQALTDRHVALRSAFAWDGLDWPVQIVYSFARAQIAFHDLCLLETELQEKRVNQLLIDDRESGADLTSPPLTRLIVLKITDTLYRLVWSMWGPIVDSWSQPIAIRELFQIYDYLSQGRTQPLPPPAAYRDFITWRSRCSFTGAEIFWRRTLDPFPGLTPVCDRPPQPAGPGAVPEHSEQAVPISLLTMTKLEDVAKAHRMTLNSLVMAVWAVVLARHCGKDFVVFGVTLSGRSPSVPGIERMVGFFMNVLPIPVHVVYDDPVVRWARRLQDLLLAIRRDEHLPATLPACWCAPAVGPFLFESLFVFENYPVEWPGGSAIRGVDLRETQGVVVSNVPLSVIVSKGWEWVQMLYDANRVGHNTVSRLLRGYARSLHEVAEFPERRVGDV
jgi:Condensation domain